jgi:hypothetical protein
MMQTIEIIGVIYINIGMRFQVFERWKSLKCCLIFWTFPSLSTEYFGTEFQAIQSSSEGTWFEIPSVRDIVTEIILLS